MILVDGRDFDSLRDVHAWTRQTRPDHVLAEASGTIRGIGTSWTVPVALTVVGGLWTGWQDGARSPGWWLSFRSNAPLTLVDGQVRHYCTGGVDYGDPDRGHGRLAVRGWTWKRIGGNGYAAVFASDAAVLVHDCRFDRLEQSPNGGNLHAVYGVRSDVTVMDCRIGRVSGDPLRVRDGSTLRVERVKARRSGYAALASAWRRPTEDPSELDVRDVDPGKTYDRTRYALAYRTVR